MTLAGTKLRSWRRRLETASRTVAAVMDEIRAEADPALVARMDEANCDTEECLGIINATIDICRDPRGKRPQESC